MENTCKYLIAGHTLTRYSYGEQIRLSFVFSLCFSLSTSPSRASIPSTYGSRPSRERVWRSLLYSRHISLKGHERPQNRSVSRNNTRCHGHPSTGAHTNVTGALKRSEAVRRAGRDSWVTLSSSGSLGSGTRRIPGADKGLISSFRLRVGSSRQLVPVTSSHSPELTLSNLIKSKSTVNAQDADATGETPRVSS